MIIQCDKCATRFRLDDSRITPNGVKVRCTKCENVFIVTPPPPPEEVQVEELFGVVPGMEDKPEPDEEKAPQPKTQQPKRKEDGKHLAFDFDSEITRDDIFKPAEGGRAGNGASQSVKTQKKEAVEQPGLSFDNLDFSFSEDRSDESMGKSAWDAASGVDSGGSEEDIFAGAFDEPISPRKQPEENDDFNLDTGLMAPPGEDGKDDDFDFGFDAPPGEDEKEDEPATPSAQVEEKPALTETISQSVAAAAYTKEAAPLSPAESGKEEEEEPAFNTVLSKAIEKDAPLSFGPSDDGEEAIAQDEEEPEEQEEEEEIEEGEGEVPEQRRSRESRMGVIIAALIIVLGGGLIYFTGIIDRLTSVLMPPSAQKVVEIESIKGFYEDNRNFGRLFVIDARVKNITGEPQEVKAATGVVYDDRGKKIAEKSVSPGRIVSVDDIKNLSREELERAFRDPSGGVIPPKGSVPVMVLFIEVPEGLSEYGVDIVR